jgi:Putative F0F1-ATPase subunit Ca2+/Mg2+ transporter
VDDLHSKRELNKGFAAATSRGFELVATIAIFTGLGWLLDRLLGTARVHRAGLRGELRSHVVLLRRGHDQARS